ncbi:hydroxyacylglutathione hydrolase [Luminiphilus sp.]|nr:hydroxyacylglutathione hydrolase [Luminiphilus sp.]
MMTISPIKAFSDNYIWLIERAQQAFVVDPGEPEPVLASLAERGLELTGILITHHHFDHTGAVQALQEKTGCDTWGPVGSPAGEFDHALSESDRVVVLGESFEVLEVPGHTLDHIAYHCPAQSALFCGDTLFVGGCGRVFEGTTTQMRASLAKLSALPTDTRIYCAHEYTLGNLAFAQIVEPGNLELAAFVAACQDKRARDIPTVPSVLEGELSYNPFLRWSSHAIRQTLLDTGRLHDDSPDGVFSAVREWKNQA